MLSFTLGSVRFCNNIQSMCGAKPILHIPWRYSRWLFIVAWIGICPVMLTVSKPTKKSYFCLNVSLSLCFSCFFALSFPRFFVNQPIERERIHFMLCLEALDDIQSSESNHKSRSENLQYFLFNKSNSIERLNYNDCVKKLTLLTITNETRKIKRMVTLISFDFDHEGSHSAHHVSKLTPKKRHLRACFY